MLDPSDNDATSARLGSVIRGKYRLDRVLGVGGMAVVFAATHRNQKQFAVKMLHPELSVQVDIRTRFLREGYAANSLKHPGAVAVLDDDVTEDGAAFLVMELLEGEGVDHLLSRHGRLPPRAVLALGVQLLDVLATAHARGIIHRDVKPPNLFLTGDGTVKVLDFGIARVRDAWVGSSQSTGSGMVLGTPAYMAPEQALARSSEIDGLTDVWAAGATLFTLLTGRLVHEGDNPAQLMIKTATAPARPLREVAPETPAAVAEVIDRALRYERSARWPGAAEMRDAIRDAYRATFGEDLSHGPLLALLRGEDRSPVPAPATTGRTGRTTEGPTSPALSPFAYTSAPPRPPDAHPSPWSGAFAPTHPLDRRADASPWKAAPSDARATVGGRPAPRRSGRAAMIALALGATLAAGALAEYELGRTRSSPGGGPAGSAAAGGPAVAAKMPSGGGVRCSNVSHSSTGSTTCGFMASSSSEFDCALPQRGSCPSAGLVGCCVVTSAMTTSTMWVGTCFYEPATAMYLRSGCEEGGRSWSTRAP